MTTPIVFEGYCDVGRERARLDNPWKSTWTNMNLGNLWCWEKKKLPCRIREVRNTSRDYHFFIIISRSQVLVTVTPETSLLRLDFE